MSDEKIIKPEKQPLHPFSKMNRNATRQEAVNAAVNSAQGVYELLSKEHDRIMGEVVARFEKNEEEFRVFREIAARRIRQLESRSLSFIIITALRADWLRFRLWLIELRYFTYPRLRSRDLAAAIEEQRAAVLAGMQGSLTLEQAAAMSDEELIEYCSTHPPDSFPREDETGDLVTPLTHDAVGNPLDAPKKAEG
jgi:hypothetical protein